MESDGLQKVRKAQQMDETHCLIYVQHPTSAVILYTCICKRVAQNSLPRDLDWLQCIGLLNISLSLSLPLPLSFHQSRQEVTATVLGQSDANSAQLNTRRPACPFCKWSSVSESETLRLSFGHLNSIAVYLWYIQHCDHTCCRVSVTIAGVGVCHENCTAVEGRRYCWGREESTCQQCKTRTFCPSLRRQLQ